MVEEEAITMHKVEIPLEWQISGDLETRFANNLVVAHSESEFYLTFFETVPPITLGDPARLAALESVTAKAVARIAVAAGRMEGFIDAMQRNLDRYRQAKELNLDQEEEN